MLDCSYTMAMVMPDESRPCSLALVEQARLVVPPIWFFEVANAFRTAVRRDRLSPQRAATLCVRLAQYESDMDGADASVHQRYIAAQTHDLTAYDAAYLDLALQRRFALATLDQRLASLARNLGVLVHD